MSDATRRAASLFAVAALLLLPAAAARAQSGQLRLRQDPGGGARFYVRVDGQSLGLPRQAVVDYATATNMRTHGRVQLKLAAQAMSELQGWMSAAKSEPSHAARTVTLLQGPTESAARVLYTFMDAVPSRVALGPLDAKGNQAAQLDFVFAFGDMRPRPTGGTPSTSIGGLMPGDGRIITHVP